MDERDAIVERVKAACNDLIEHVDSVQILVTFHEGDNAVTGGFDFGLGNHCARLGQMVEWVDTQRQYGKTCADMKQRDDLDGDS